MYKPDALESALRNAILACRPDALISMVSGKHNLVLTVVVERPISVRTVVTEDNNAGNESDPYFDIWYGLVQIEDEASAWLRERGLDDETTVGFIKDKAEMCRKMFEEMTR